MPTKGIDESVIFRRDQARPNFRVGVPIFVEHVQKKRRLRAQAQIVGWSENNIFIITLPADNRMLIVPTGAELIIRYLLDGTVYGFITRLLHKQHGPFGMWMLEYPQVVEVKNLRRAPRIPLYLKVLTEDEEEWDMLDISNFGAAMAAAESQFVGDEIRISFSLPDGAKVDDLECKIVRVLLSEAESIVGVQFSETDADNLAKINAYIESCLRRQHLVQQE